MISSDPDSLSVCGMIDECDAPSVYQTLRRFDFLDSVGGRSDSQIILESVKDAIVKPLRVAGLTRVLVPFCLLGEMRAAIVSLKDKDIHLMKYPRMQKINSGLSNLLFSLNIRGFRGQRLEYFEILRRLRPKVVMVQENLAKREDLAVTIPGYEFFHDFAREGSNHGVLFGISKGHIAQRIPGIKGKLVVAQGQLDEQTIKFGSFYLPCISTTEKALTTLKNPAFTVDFNMSNSALSLLLMTHNTGYSVVDFSGCSKFFFGNGDKAWSTPERLDSMQKEICYDNFRSSLANLEDTSTMEADEIAATFVETSKKIAVELNLYKASNHSQNGREHWKWVRRLLSDSLYTKHNISAVRDEAGNLLTSPDKVMQRWSEFYTALSSDSTGNSRNPDRWIEVLGNKKYNPLDMNQDISCDKVSLVLMSLALHKAPSGDGLEVGWYKILFNNYDVYCPKSPMAKAPLNLLQTIWRNGKIPKIWNITEIVPIPKKGGLKLLENYTVIALIPVGMKILVRIIIGGITRQLDARKKIYFLQAGFRTDEQAMVQVVSQYDILGRRRVAKKENFVAFIDFRKAYDTLPMYALLRKLYLCGVEGRAYEFFAAYYKSPEVRVRIGTLLSPFFKVDKGVRQKCPMSPMLFNIFINDILDKVNENIALVSGNSVKILGILFADDLVLIADSEVDFRENLQVEKWVNDNKMSFGISKSGTLAVVGSFEHREILELQGKMVSIV
ncbi:LINE-1 reverse transcriptase-like protein [Smittium culicis]|uniref:LINE-1 reverse transcriptase-like protein n=1 Tax=Smittium culicis TaxID=133412 RepID=A0A1R1YP82_9FUNG|nr:LINE-1 reverse transcriptase-like protein [Smittium culicis]